MSSGNQPSRALLIAAGILTQVIGAVCLVLALASLPVVADLKTGMSGVIASIVASLAAIVCGTLVWRGRLVPLALAAGLDIGFGVGLPRGGSAIGAMLRILPANELDTAETLITVAAIMMFVAAILCVLAVPSALKLRQWARTEIAISSQLAAQPSPGSTAPGWRPEPAAPMALGGFGVVDETARTKERAPIRRRTGDTLPGVGNQRLMPTQVLRVPGQPTQGTPVIIVGVAVTLIAIGVIVISAATSGGADKQTIASSGATGSSVTGSADGEQPTATTEPITTPAPIVALDAAPEPPAVEDFIARFHAALGTGTAADLGLIFDATVFAFGVEANDLAEGRDAVVAQLRQDIGEPPAGGFTVTSKFANLASDRDVAWFAEELRVGSKTFVITGVAGLRDGAWTIAALHWATAMPNETAYRLAREGELGVPDAIPNTNDASPLAEAMRTAFASKPSFVEARSRRADAFNFGSASGERLKGGEAIRKVFSRIRATIRLHDAVKVGAIGERGGWGAANVDFTDADKDGTEVTQTFRVLAAWVKEDAGWRIVQTQWSNPR